MSNKEMEEVVAKNKDVIEILQNMAAVEYVERQNKLNVITQYAVTITVWLVLGCASSFAVWGLIVGLDLCVKALGLK